MYFFLFFFLGGGGWGGGVEVIREVQQEMLLFNKMYFVKVIHYVHLQKKPTM
jgi:hypothetical protein